MEMATMPKQPIKSIIFVFVMLLAGLLSAGLPAAYCWGADKTSENSTITLDVKNEPLRSVLEKMSKTTRWKIQAPDKWMDKPVTQTLNKATLEEGLRSVLTSAGIEDLLLMYDENIKVVTLFDTEGPQKQAAGRPPAPIRVQTPQPPLISTSGRPDPILERAAQRAAGNAPPRGSRRSRRMADKED